MQDFWDLEHWHKTFFRSFKGILNISLIEASLKVITRWYLTPSRLSIMYPSVSPLCFRGCNMKGTMIHIWWECPKIRSFWTKIFQIISKVTALTVPRSPLTALLNHQIPGAPKYKHKLIFFILLGAKLTLAKAWKLPKVSVIAAKRKISWIMAQEKMVSSMLDTSVRFEKTWEPWAKYVGVGVPSLKVNSNE